MKRTVINCLAADHQLVGTFHDPSSRAGPRARTGVLLLNPGPAPRAGNSDLSAHLCDHLAERGVPSFRFDLPGLGDSMGTPWPDVSTYWRSAQRGGNDEAIRSLINHLCERYDLDAVIAGGLCSGAICAIRVSDLAFDRLAGLILLEPNFRASPNVERHADAKLDANGDPPRGAAAKARGSRSFIRRARRAMSINELLRILTGDGRAARFARPCRPVLQKLLAHRIGDILPADILLPVVMTWARALERPIPTLVVLARGLIADRYLTRIVEAVPGFRHDALDRARLDDTGHILTTGDGRRQTVAAVETWLAQRFPGVLQAPPAVVGGPEFFPTQSAVPSAPALDPMASPAFIAAGVPGPSSAQVS